MTSHFILRTALALVAAGLVVVGLAWPSSQPARASINDEINFQGRLLTAAGAVIPDGNYNVEYKIYTGGTGAAAGDPGGTLQWTEDWTNTGGHPVVVKNGYFSIMLGSLTTLPSTATLDNPTIWLSMNVAAGANATATCGTFSACGGDGEMVPMDPFGAAPYAINAANADALGGISSTGYIQNVATNLTQQQASINLLNPAANAALAGAELQQTASATAPVLLLKGGATPGAGADLLQLQNSLAAVMDRFDSSGNLYMATGDGIDAQTTTGTLVLGGTSSTTNATTIDLGVTGGSTAQTINVATSTNANTVNIASGAITSGAESVNIGTASSGSGKDTIIIGSANGNSTTTIEGGSSGTVGTPSIAVGNGITNHVIEIGSNSLSSNSVYLGSAGLAGLVQTAAGAFQTQLQNTGLTLSDTTNSPTAFQVQNAVGTTFLNADSTKDVISTQDLSVGLPANNSDATRLFSDGFENGNDDMWTATGGVAQSGSTGSTGTVTVATTNPHTGKYSASFVTAGNTAYEQTNFAATATVFGRTYFDVTSAMGNPTMLTDIGTAVIGTGNHLYTYVGTSGDVCWGIAGTFGTLASGCTATVVTASVWHKVETEFVANGSTGVLKIWLDNVLIKNSTGLNTGTNNIDNFAIGSNSNSTDTVYYDDVAVDTVQTGDSGSLYVQDSLHVAGTSNFGDSLEATSVDGYGIKGISVNNLGVQGFSTNSNGVQGYSTNGVGIQGISYSGTSGQFQSGNAADTNPTLMALQQGASTANLFVTQSGGVNSFVVASTGATTITPSTNTTSALQVQNSNGTSQLNVSTTTGILTLAGNENFTQVAAPSAAGLTLAAGTGTGLTGKYYYVVAFQTADGQTNFGVVSPQSASLANTGMTVSTIPTGTVGTVTGRLIYRTIGGGAATGPFYLDKTIADDTTTSYTDNVTDATLTTNAQAPVINTSDGSAGQLTLGGTGILQVDIASNNVSLGQALTNNTSGVGNNAQGVGALLANTTGSNDVAIGANALNGNTTGYSNTIVGNSAFGANTTGFANTALGQNAGAYLQTSSGNTLLGYNNAGAVAETSGDNNTIVGGNNANFLGTTLGATGNIILGFGNYSTGSAQSLSGDVVLANNVVESAATAANYLDLGNVLFGNTSTGSAYIKPTAGNDSTTEFVVQNAAGTQNVLTVDTLSNANNGQLVVGSATTSTDQTLLQLNSNSNYSSSEPTCSATSDQGALYWNTNTSSLRACTGTGPNSGWTDVETTDGLGLLAFGVLSGESVTGVTAGDVAGVSNQSTSPCKVVWTSATTLQVEACIAYSSGRRVSVAQTTISLTTTNMAASQFNNVCISATTGQPALVSGTSASTETTATIWPAFSATSPILCLATLKASATAGHIGNIWDTRTFTDTEKQYATVETTAAVDGWLVEGTGVVSGVVLPQTTTTAEPLLRGVVVATADTASTTTINAIIAVRGQVWVKFPAATAAVVNDVLTTVISGTAGYGASVANPAISNYATGGLVDTTTATTCTTENTAASDCQASALVDFAPAR